MQQDEFQQDEFQQGELLAPCAASQLGACASPLPNAPANAVPTNHSLGYGMPTNHSLGNGMPTNHSLGCNESPFLTAAAWPGKLSS